MTLAPPPAAREVELKLAVTPSALEVLRRAPAIAQAAIGPEETRELDSTYFDTPDRRLARRKVGLRVRRIGERFIQTLKTAGTFHAGVAVRGEWERPIVGPDPNPSLFDDPAAHRALGFLKPGELVPVFRTVFTRTTRRVLWSSHGGELAEVEMAFDTGSIVVDDRPEPLHEPLHELELELKSGDASALYDLALTCHAVAPVRVETASKAERGFTLAHGQPPQWRMASDMTLTAEQTVESAMAAVFRHCLAHWSGNEAAVLEGRVEGVHQMRVGLRRMRSALTLFKPILSDADRAWLRSELGWLARGLGPAREWDVFVEDLLQPISAGPADVGDVAVLRSLVLAERERAHEAARAVVGDPRYTALVLRLGGWLAGRRWRQGWDRQHAKAAEPVRALALAVLEKRHRQVLRRGRGFDSLAIDARHAVRIEVKRLRYAVEFFAALFPRKATRPFRKSLEALQDALGHLNDVAVTHTLLDGLVARGGSDGAVVSRHAIMAAGLVIGWHTRGLADMEPRLRGDWQAFAATAPFWTEVTA